MNFKFQLLSFAFILFLIPFKIDAQKSKVKFGEFSKEEKEMTDCAFEPGAAAIILLDQANTIIKNLPNKGIEFISLHHKKIKILNKEGYDYANITLEEVNTIREKVDVTNIKAKTFNKANGKWEATDFDKKNIIEEKVSKGITELKIVMPNVKVWSIIEITYKRITNLMENWYFQDELPTLISDFEIILPDRFDFVKSIEGAFPIKEKTAKEDITVFLTRDGSITLDSHKYGWIGENLPTLKEENYSPSFDLNVSHIDFLLKGIRYQNEYIDIDGTYKKLNEDLLKAEGFGKRINNDLVKVLPELGLSFSSESDEEKAKKIFYTIQSKIKWDGFYAFFPEFGPQKIIRKGEGDVADINILLIKSLREAGVKAYPIVCKTRRAGRPNPYLVDKPELNYLVCGILNDDESYTLLDASDPTLPYGLISPRVLNYQGYLIDKVRSGWVDLQKNVKYEHGMGIKLKIDDGKLLADVKGRFKNYAALKFFEEDKKEKKEDEEEEKDNEKINDDKDLKNRVLEDWDVKSAEFISLEKDKPVSFEMKMEKDFDTDEDLIYLEPVIMPLFDENPFQDKERRTPIDFPYQMKIQYAITIEIPEGYAVEELPEKSLVTLPDNDCKFIYSPEEKNGNVQLNVNFSVKKLFYEVEEYELLREFFNLSLEKMEGMIVLKKQ